MVLADRALKTEILQAAILWIACKCPKSCPSFKDVMGSSTGYSVGSASNLCHSWVTCYIFMGT